ncbi:MAG: MBL fold metallo-hydrolase [Planctomycetes bacterium]|nr:MBL fold metallo-hydrolase [Planctomycetota bacterium]
MNQTRSATGISVTFHGAAQTVTGSMHLLETPDARILLDCGLMLGQREEVHRRNSQFPFAPSWIDAVLLSHAHIDHCGNLPNLVRQGFTGPIYCTPATRDLMGIMLTDSAKIQAEEAALAPRVDECSTALLYTGKEVEQTLRQCVSVPYGMSQDVAEGVRVQFHDAGHLLGSAIIAVACNFHGATRTITFTGDLGRDNLHFLGKPAPLPPSDMVICESTYGGRLHQTPAALMKRLHEVVKQTIERGGKVLIPAFSLGRAQIVVHYLREAMQQGRLPLAPVFVDSPLATRIAQVYRRHPGCLAAGVLDTMNDGEAVRYVSDFQESRDLSFRKGPCILVASGGMCEAGRILHHLEKNIDDPRNSVVLVSYQAPGSLGHRMLERGPRVRVRRKMCNKWADIIDLNGFSGHADQQDLMRALRPLAASQPRVRLVHGDLSQAWVLAAVLRGEGFEDVAIPQREDSASLA